MRRLVFFMQKEALQHLILFQFYIARLYAKKRYDQCAVVRLLITDLHAIGSILIVKRNGICPGNYVPVIIAGVKNVIALKPVIRCKFHIIVIGSRDIRIWCTSIPYIICHWAAFQFPSSPVSDCLSFLQE